MLLPSAQATAPAEADAKAKDAFLANASQEIRTPLHVIIGVAHLLDRDETDETQRLRLGRLLEGAENLLAIIDDILDLSEANARRIELDTAPFSLAAVVAKVERMLEPKAAAKGLALIVALDPKLRSTHVFGDAQRLTQVLLNLCRNAITFTQSGWIALSVIGLADDGTQVHVRLSVEDTGIGIAVEDQQRLFEAFEQADNASTRRGGDLGLVISQYLSNRMGSSIQVISGRGTGSEFFLDLLLDRAEAPPAAASGVHSVRSKFAGARILFAEDHRSSQQVLLEMLEDLRCEAEVAANGFEAVERARIGHFDCILMDVQMPGMDGLAATRAIRNMARHEKTPIIALTANASAADRLSCLRAGMTGHLAKPVTRAALAATFTRWLPEARAADMAPDWNSALRRCMTAMDGLEVSPPWLTSGDALGSHCDRLSAFLESSAESLQRIKELLLAANQHPAGGLAHQIKGIAGLLGAARIETIAASLEDRLKKQAGADGLGQLLARYATWPRAQARNSSEPV